MELDVITSWNAERGFGHTRKGVFVHATVLCGCVRPSRGEAAPIGTKLFLVTEMATRGERATKARCEKCSGPAKFEAFVIGTSVHPITGEQANKIEYRHVGGEYQFAPKADNTAFEAIWWANHRWNGRDFYEAEFGLATFVAAVDGEVIVCQSKRERRVTIHNVACYHPEWMTFVRLHIRRQSGEWRGSARAYAVFTLPDGSEVSICAAQTCGRSAHGVWEWRSVDSLPDFAKTLPALATLMTRVERRLGSAEHVFRLWRHCAQATAEALRIYGAAASAIERGEIEHGSHYATWTEEFGPSDDEWRPGGSYQASGTIYTARAGGHEIGCKQGPFLNEEATPGLLREARKPLVAAIRALVGNTARQYDDVDQIVDLLIPVAYNVEPPHLPRPTIETIAIAEYPGMHGATLFGVPTSKGEAWEWTYDRDAANQRFEAWLCNGHERLVQARAAKQAVVVELVKETEPVREAEAAKIVVATAPPASAPTPPPTATLADLQRKFAKPLRPKKS